jgi:hypothetical protein
MWQLQLSNLSPGIYRVDVEVGDGVAWRQFFKLTDYILPPPCAAPFLFVRG